MTTPIININNNKVIIMALLVVFHFSRLFIKMNNLNIKDL